MDRLMVRCDHEAEVSGVHDPLTRAVVTAKLKVHPRLRAAVVVASLDRRPAHADDVSRTADLLTVMGPRGEVDVPTLALLVSGRARLDVDEYLIYRDLLPQYNGDLTPSLAAGAGRMVLRFGFTFKKSGVHYEVEFAGHDSGADKLAMLGFPGTINLEVTNDNDDVDTHGDGCPVLCEEADDCDCEPYVVHSVSAPLDSTTTADRVRLAAWLEAEILGPRGKIVL